MVRTPGPFGEVFTWDPLVVFLVFSSAVGILWLIEFSRSYFDEARRPPYGLAIFRWNTNWLGDSLGLPLAMAGIALFYQKVRTVEENWFVNGWWISLAALLVAVAITLLFVGKEEVEGAYQGADKWSANRLFHTPFFGLMVFLLFDFVLRFIALWAIGFEGGSLGMLMVVVGFSLWFICFVADGAGIKNPIWQRIEERWPMRTRVQ